MVEEGEEGITGGMDGTQLAGLRYQLTTVVVVVVVVVVVGGGGGVVGGGGGGQHIERLTAARMQVRMA